MRIDKCIDLAISRPKVGEIAWRIYVYASVCETFQKISMS